jgi:AhpD family alkylhydroperoxidase
VPFSSPLTDDQAPDAAKSLFHALQSKLKLVPNIFRTMGHAPAVLRGTLDFDAAILHLLDHKFRELAYLKTASVLGCQYCQHHHKAFGRKAGVSDKQIQDLERFASGPFSELEKDVLRFARQWTRLGNVESRLLDRLSRGLTPGQLAVLAATVGLANWTSRFNESFGVQLP